MIPVDLTRAVRSMDLPFTEMVKVAFCVLSGTGVERTKEHPQRAFKHIGQQALPMLYSKERTEDKPSMKE